jgi:flagellar biosynthesis protein FliR
LALNNEKKIPLSNPNKVKLFFGISLSSTLTPFLMALYTARRVNRRYIMLFLQLFFGGLLLLFLYLGHKK